MGSPKILIFIGVPLGGMRSSRARSSKEEKVESEMSKEGLISLKFCSGDGVPDWYTPEGYYWSTRAPKDMGSFGCSLTSYPSM